MMYNCSMTNEFMTIKEIAKIKGVTRQAIDKKIRKMKIAYRQIGRTIIIDKADADKLTA